MFANANRGKDVEPYTDISIFLPHPAQWTMDNSDRAVKCSAKTAIEFLNTYKQFDLEVKAVFDSWMSELSFIASMQ